MEADVVNRLMALLGLAVVLVAIAAGLLTGAASAAAQTGTDGDGTKTSESTQQSTPDSQPDSDKPAGSVGEQDSQTSPKTDQPKNHKTSHPATKTDKRQTDKSAAAADKATAKADKVDKSEATADKPDATADKSEAKPATPAAKADKTAASLYQTSTAPAQSTVAAEDVSSGAESTPQQDDVHEAASVAVSTRSIVAVTDKASTPRAPTLVDVVGSIVLNVVMGLIHAFDGAPVLPPGSTVTVRTSTLTMPVAGGRTVEADWYFPDDETPTRLIYFQHGLGASGPMYSYTAATLAEQTHSIVVAPSLTSNFFDADGAWLGGTPMQQAVADLFLGDRQALTQSASAAAGYEVTLPTRFVLAGHSLGGSLVMGAAGDMVDNGAIHDLAGVLLLDSVDVNNSVPTALQKLKGANYRPVYDISSERYVWNMFGTVGDELEAARPGQFNGVMLVGGRHIDALQGGNPFLQLSEYLIAGFSQPRNVEAVKTLAVGWVNDMFAGTHDGIYGAPQQRIEIHTSAGTATAVVLPFTSRQAVQATPFDWLLNAILNLVGQNFFVAQPLAGRADLVAA
jgi:Alpha/beta hydrolase family